MGAVNGADLFGHLGEGHFSADDGRAVFIGELVRDRTDIHLDHLLPLFCGVSALLLGRFGWGRFYGWMGPSVQGAERGDFVFGKLFEDYPWTVRRGSFPCDCADFHRDPLFIGLSRRGRIFLRGLFVLLVGHLLEHFAGRLGEMGRRKSFFGSLHEVCPEHGGESPPGDVPGGGVVVVSQPDGCRKIRRVAYKPGVAEV